MIDWLPMSDRKGIPSPLVLYRDIEHAGGYFMARQAERYIDDELGLDLRERDVIVLSTHWGEPSASIVAHEFRHLCQHYSLSLPQIGRVLPVGDYEDIEDWARQIRAFYLSQPWEADALRYSMRVARDDYCEQQWEACLQNNRP